GRKATDSDLLTFIRGAFDKEQGVVVPSELSPADLARTVDFVRFLAPPPVLGVDRYGEEMFQAAGCATCHVPTFKTRSSIEALDRKIVYIYSDLLLHDMGAALADLCKGVATRAEFRTEPLIGLRNRTRSEERRVGKEWIARGAQYRKRRSKRQAATVQVEAGRGW